MKRKTVQVSVAPIIINEKLGDFFIVLPNWFLQELF